MPFADCHAVVDVASQICCALLKKVKRDFLTNYLFIFEITVFISDNMQRKYAGSSAHLSVKFTCCAETDTKFKLF